MLPYPSLDISADCFLRAAQTVRPCSPIVRWVSTVTGSRATGETLVAPSYWTDHTRGPARLMGAMRALESEDISMFLELGPAAELSALGPACLSEHARAEALWLPALSGASSPEKCATL